MGGKIEHLFQVEQWRKGLPGYEVVATSVNVSIARWAFWGTVAERGTQLRSGDQLLLRHGARVIVTYPPEPPSW